MARSRRRAMQAGLILLLLVVLAGGILSLFIRRHIPPVQWVGLGITAYDELPPRSASRRDVLELQRFFDGLHTARPREFSPIIRLEDNLTRESLKKELARQLAVDEQPTILAYVSLHSLVVPENEGSLHLAAIHAGVDAIQGNQPSELIPVAELIELLLNVPAGKVVLLVDAGRTDPDGRLGILARDGVEVLRQLCDKNNHTRLHVLCACSPGEESWTVATNPQQKDAGKPEASSPTTGNAAALSQGPRTIFSIVIQEALEGACDGWKSGKKNGVIDWEEFSSFVVDRVGSEAKQRWGESQQVLVLGNPATFDLMPVRQVPPPQTDADAPEDAATADEGNTKSAQREAPAATGQTEAAAGRASDPVRLTPESLRQRLDEQWDRFTQNLSRGTGRSESAMQRQYLLLRAEQELAAGLYERCDRALAGIDQLDRLSDGSGPASAVPALSVAWSSLDGGAPLALGSSDRTRLSKLADELIKKAQAEASAPPDAGARPAAEGATSPWQDARTRQEFGLYVWEDAVRNGTASRDFAGMLSELDRAGWPTAEWPIELLILQTLAQRGNAAATAGLERRFLTAVDRAHRMIPQVWTDPQVFRHFEPQLNEALRALLAAERWLVHDTAPARQTTVWLDAADRHLEHAESLSQTWRELARMRVGVRLDWSRMANWLARRDEAIASVDLNAAEELAKRLERRPRLATISEEELAAWPLSGTTPAGANVREQHLRLVSLMADVQKIEQMLATTPAEGRGELQELEEQVRPLLAQVRRRYQDLLREFHDEVRRLDTSNPTTDDHRDARRLLRSSLLDAEERRRLRSLLEIRSSGSLTAASAGRAVRESGLWVGFWGIAGVELAGADEATLSGLWTAWRKLGQSMTRQDGSEIAARAELGRGLNQAWNRLESELTERLDQFTPIELEALVYSLPGHASLRIDPVSSAMAKAKNVLRQDAVTGLVSNWSARPYAAAVVQRARQSGMTVAQVREPTWDLPGEARCDSQRRAAVAMQFTGTADSGPLSLLLYDAGGRGLTVRYQDQVVAEGSAVPLGDRSQTIEFSASADVVRPRSVGLALVAADGYPYHIGRLTVLPPFDPSQFSIEFVTADGAVVYPGRIAASQRSRFNLPPTGEAVLKPVLIRPAGHPTRQMAIECYAGDPRSGKLLFKTEVDLAPDATRIDIAPKPLAADAAATPPPATAPAEGTDVSRGLVFRLMPDGQPENTFEFSVQPDLWLPTQFIDVPRPALISERLVVDVVSKVPQFDPATGASRGASPPALVVPQQIPVKLELAPGWEGLLRPGALLENPELELGKTTQLFVTIDSEQLQLLREPVEFMLSVAGWPHAFRWRVGPSGIERVTETAVRIAAPAHDSVFVPPAQPGEFSTPVRLEVYGEDLDLGITERESWSVDFDVRLKAEGFDGPLLGVGQQWPVHGRAQRKIVMSGPAGGLWTFRTQVSDFETALDLRGLGIGQYELVARLNRNRTSVGTDRILFAKDSEDSKPAVEFTSPVPNPYHDFQKSLMVTGTARDPESRIRKVRIGIDLDGDRQIGPNEPLKEQVYDDRGRSPPAARSPNASVSFEARFEAKELPQKAGRYALLLEAENRAGMSSRAVRLIDLNSTSPPPVVAPTTGRLVVTFQGDTRVDLELGELKKTRERTMPSVTFDDLPAGQHTLKWRAPVTRGAGSELVRIEVGKTTTIQLRVAR